MSEIKKKNLHLRPLTPVPLHEDDEESSTAHVSFHVPVLSVQISFQLSEKVLNY